MTEYSVFFVTMVSVVTVAEENGQSYSANGLASFLFEIPTVCPCQAATPSTD